MNSKTYRITICSPIRFIVTLSLLITAGMLVAGMYMPRFSSDGFLNWMVLLLIFIFMYYLAYLFSRAKVEIQLTEQGLIHRWEKNFLLSKNKEIRIPWEMIDSYQYESDRNCDSFIIFLNNGMKYEISRNNLINDLRFFSKGIETSHNDFNRLSVDFQEVANFYKKQKHPGTSPVTYNKKNGFYKSKVFKWMLVVIAIVLTGYLLLFYFNELNL